MIFWVSGVARGAPERGPAAGAAARSARMNPFHPAAACPRTLGLTSMDEKGSMTKRQLRAWPAPQVRCRDGGRPAGAGGRPASAGGSPAGAGGSPAGVVGRAADAGPAGHVNLALD
jgi:hypothetical protein